MEILGRFSETSLGTNKTSNWRKNYEKNLSSREWNIAIFLNFSFWLFKKNAELKLFEWTLLNSKMNIIFIKKIKISKFMIFASNTLIFREKIGKIRKKGCPLGTRKFFRKIFTTNFPKYLEKSEIQISNFFCLSPPSYFSLISPTFAKKNSQNNDLMIIV